ncbi:ParB/Srx family N-terminal domain-containing protein [Vibrio parahaemolyticus]|uniref:ParB/Srx family N-terminal domain-containing protein n=1 Tax=Vibrio parahaemolyticus TaxID=670 RepID=UPI001E31725B|nr:ParB/Srx family N-terminal domain-containing protein [Vibrio parahaemolyticus]EID7698982.1 hypothetical protein [Vibrio parahaemolyticus]EJG1424715.1 hypothetical protein [Vibrio parahaemolyticus]MDG2845362.1 ParB/Srx family N-terminal domain-containing protein [Vibrio parahaemolyticus]
MLTDETVTIKQLLLDPNNLRLDYDIVQDEIPELCFLNVQEETLDKLENENIDDLRESILSNGFIEVDRIVVREAKELNEKHKPSNPYYVVVEGNRRTAALMGLYDDYRNGLIQVNELLKNKFSAINVCCIDDTDDDSAIDASASLMGIRHVSGPKQWKGIQSAKLIAQLYGKGRSFREISDLLGIDERDAKRRYEGYMAFVQMRKEKGSECKSNHYALLLEFISNKTARDWLEWKEDHFSNEKNLNTLYNHLLKTGTSKPQITNTTLARDFNRHLAISSHKHLLESGEVLSNLPELAIDIDKKINHISRFITFVNNLHADEISDEVSDKLSKLSITLNNKLKGTV